MLIHLQINSLRPNREFGPIFPSLIGPGPGKRAAESPIKPLTAGHLEARQSQNLLFNLPLTEELLNRLRDATLVTPSSGSSDGSSGGILTGL
jgi:hypothetical protein